MLSTIIVLVLLAAVIWLVWEMWNNGWDLKKAGAAIVAALAAWWAWAGDIVSSLTGM